MASDDLFSLRIVDVSHYMHRPIYGLDPCFSEFRGKEIKSVPVIRIFGSTSEGIKSCLHVHGVLPYFYIPCENTGKESLDKFMYQLCENLDKALNVSLGQSSSQMHHIFKVQLVKAYPFYGYHRREHLFLKIYMYNPRLLKRASNLLQNGALNGKSFQAFDSHVPYRLQFLIDYNLFPMSFLRAQMCEIKVRETKDIPINISTKQILGKKVEKHSTSKLEVDIVAVNILNRIDLQAEIVAGRSINPGIESIWQDEEIRRKLLNIKENLNLPVLEMPVPDERPIMKPTDSEIFYRSALERKLVEYSSQISDTTSDNTVFLNNSSNNLLSERRRGFNVARLLKNSIYPDEYSQEVDLLNATIVQDHLNQANIRTLSNFQKEVEVLNLEGFNQETLDEQNILNLSQNLCNLNDTITCEQNVFDFIKQLDQEDNEEPGIDLNSSLAPYSDSQQNCNKEVLEFLRQLSDDDDNVQDQINNLTQRIQSDDSEDDCLNNYTVANEDIEDILSRLSQTINPSLAEKGNVGITQLDGMNEDIFTPKKHRTAQSKSTPSPVKHSQRTPRSSRRDRYKALQGITTCSPKRTQIKSSSDSEVVFASSDEELSKLFNATSRKKLRKRKYSLRKRDAAKKYFDPYLNSDDVISLSSTDSSNIGTRKCELSLNKTKTKITCNLKPHTNKSANTLKLESYNIGVQKIGSHEIKLPLMKEGENVSNENSSYKISKFKKSRNTIATKLMRSKLKDSINATISDREIEKQHDIIANSFGNNIHNTSNDSLKKSTTEINENLQFSIKKFDHTSENMQLNPKVLSNKIEETKQNKKINKITMQPHVIANLKELGLCFLDKFKVFEEQKQESIIIPDFKKDSKETCTNTTDIFKNKKQIQDSRNKTEGFRENLLFYSNHSLRKCKVKIKRLKSKKIYSFLKLKSINSPQNSQTVNLNIQQNLERRSSVDNEADNLNIYSFYENSFHFDSPSMFSDAGSGFPIHSDEIKERNLVSRRNSNEHEKVSESMSPLRFSEGESADGQANVKSQVLPENFKELAYLPSSLDEVIRNLPIYEVPEVVNQMPFYSNPNDVRKAKEVGHFVLHIPLQINLNNTIESIEKKSCDNETAVVLNNNLDDTEKIQNVTDDDDDSPIKIRRQKAAMILNETDDNSIKNENCSFSGLANSFVTSSINLKVEQSKKENTSENLKISLSESIKKPFSDISSELEKKKKSFQKKLFDDFPSRTKCKLDDVDKSNKVQRKLMKTPKESDTDSSGSSEVILKRHFLKSFESPSKFKNRQNENDTSGRSKKLQRKYVKISGENDTGSSDSSEIILKSHFSRKSFDSSPNYKKKLNKMKAYLSDDNTTSTYYSENERLCKNNSSTRTVKCSEPNLSTLKSDQNKRNAKSANNKITPKKFKIHLKRMSFKTPVVGSSAKIDKKKDSQNKSGTYLTEESTTLKKYNNKQISKIDILSSHSPSSYCDQKSQKSNDSHINGVPIEVILSDEVSVEEALAIKKQNLIGGTISDMTANYLNKSLKKNMKQNCETSFGLSGASLDNTYGFKTRLENLQQAKADFDYNYLTTMSLEVFVKTRGTLHPNPVFDEICGIFYAILNDVPEKCETPAKLSGYIISAQPNDKNPKLTGVEGKVTIVNNEAELFETLLELVRLHDPDILAGYEIEMSSWGYLLDRSRHLNINFIQLLSRVPSQKVYENFEDNEPKESYTDLDHESKIYGRILLDVWRLMRSEIALTSYTFENVVYHILHKRVPAHSYHKLTEWYLSMSTRWIVLEYYLERANGVIELLDQLDLIGRTCEMAKLIGIQFYEILSRGSQYRVESMMLRIAKPKNLIPMSPSPQQRLHMRAPEYLPLILEPQSRFYADPLIVLDFQSLYPSIMIAYNYCFSTCLGRVEHLGSSSPFEFGVSMLRVSPTMLRKLLAYDMITISPCGAVFVKQAIREGVLPQMVREILDTRLMVKNSMKLHKTNQILQRVLHSRQLALKLMANVTYGYTAANFSGRMPCVEVGDSVVAKGRETLERAIKLVEATPRWGAEVVYGDTDSLFVLCPGKTRQTAFKIGEEIAAAVTKDNPFPVKLKLEKVYQPSILQTKKRYVGFMYETPDQVEPVYEAKGIETVRRDGCPAVVKMLEKSLRILFETKDVSKVKQYVCRQFSKILQGQANVQDLIFAKEFRGRFGYKPGACVPALELTRKWMINDPRKEPRRGERVPYIVTNGPPGVPIIKLIRCPHDVLNDEGYKINSIYYITKAIIPALNRCFLLIGADVNDWFAELPRRNAQLLQFVNNSKYGRNHYAREKKTTISQYFASTNCVIDCGKQTKNEICNDCAKDVQNCVITLQYKISKLARSFLLTEKICQSCTGRQDNINCKSLDCPVLFVKEVKRREYQQISYFNQLVDKIA